MNPTEPPGDDELESIPLPAADLVRPPHALTRRDVLRRGGQIAVVATGSALLGPALEEQPALATPRAGPGERVTLTEGTNIAAAAVPEGMGQVRLPASQRSASTTTRRRAERSPR